MQTVKEDFTVEYKVNDGSFETARVKDFTYDKANKNVVMTFEKISGAVDTKNVTVKVTYKGVSKTAEFTVELGSGVKYYVDATSGKDSNNGTSSETAWQTLERVNKEVFQPGDQILFKAGETWTGALKPQGSGVEGAPIVIASYGEGKKPILKPGADWTISHMNIANKVVRNPRVNNVITFFNQEYWEVRDLELYDPTYAQNTNTYVYRRGINVSAEDAGDLSYFKFDNLTIHGFRGPISNEGKSSGGIIMTVTTNLNDPSKRVPTAVHDISVTNCELYDLGRSGINFVSPWTTKEDFTVEYKVNDGSFETARVKDFTYDKANKNVVMTFEKISGAVDTKNVTVKVTYKGVSKTAEFTVELGSGVKYYVDATSGKDSNNGTSSETAWQTLERVNKEVFQPGDQILFKAGETWTGALKPQGSGVEGAPIVIASYGEGKKPILKPGADWTISHMNIANKVVRNPRVNNVITFFNQEYWEVRDLELYDPTYAQNTNTYVYRRGINVSAEDAGDLSYFKFDNLTIHGFRGPISNEGKSSGGIIMTVTTNLNDPSKRVPTAVHDISVTNCELYDLGRSGINFVSPWTTRNGAKWNKYRPFGYRGLGDWKPYERFTLSNNIIHDIDGDGTIVDGCKDVMVDHNTVYRTVYNCWYGVGLFNWNSDNVVFEYNEVYEASPADALLGAGDGQGIEIDALNQNTLVQYNYLHDNAGGVFMWCCTEDLRGFDGIYRYNISQNDGAKHGVIDWRPGHEGSMAYNNTIYLGEGIDREWLKNGYTGGKSDAKFYNNIVVNKGKMTLGAGFNEQEIIYLGEGIDREWLKNGYTGGKSDAKFYNNIVVNKGKMTLGAGFNEQEIDYESNIFVGFNQVPTNDTAVIQEDPKFVAPGTGANGIDSLKGYQLQADSPAIDAGMNIENNGGKDYFGTKLTDGKTDIGAAEYVAATSEVDKSMLESAIQYAEEQMADPKYEDVIPAARKAYEKAYEDAKAVFANPEATEKEVSDAFNALADAGHKLNWYKGDLTDLRAAYEMFEGKDLSVYTEETRKALEEALAEAKEIIDLGDNAVKEFVDAALEKLNAAIKGLEVIPVDNSKLEKLVKEAEKYEAKIDEYTEETAKTFTEMLADARDVLSKEAVSQTTLQQAIFELRLIPNKDKLEALINKVENTDLSGYTAESVAVLKTALFEAKAVMADSKADQKAVDKAVQVLQEKFDGLVAVGEETKAEKDALKDLIDKTEKMDLKSYTAETVLAVRNALKEAKAVYDDKDATQQEVDAVLAKLQKAVDGLKKADVPKTEDDKKPAKTGDATLPIGWVLAGVVAVLAAVETFFARRKRQ